MSKVDEGTSEGPMDELDRDEVERVARLARLELTEEEASALAREMASILGHFREIRRRGADGVEPGAPAGGAPIAAGADGFALRPDRVDPDALRSPVPEMAPEWRDGHFVVPRLDALSGSPGHGGNGPSEGDQA